MTVQQIRDVVLKADPNAKHYYYAKDGGSFTVWAEYRRLPFAADDLANKGWAFQVDRYTKVEYDPVAEAIERALDEAEIAYSYQVEYDQETGYIRHLFDCEGL